jgi:HEAT repeat protein
MPSDLEQTLERLLQPTGDETAWYDAVAALPAAEAVPRVAAVLGDPGRPGRERLQAALILGVLGSPAAAPALRAAMAEANPVLRARAADALGRVGAEGSEAVDALLQALRDDDYFVRESAAKALARLGRSEALPLLAAMRDGDEAESNRAVAGEAIDAIRGTA